MGQRAELFNAGEVEIVTRARRGCLHKGKQVASGAESEGHAAAFQSRRELELAQPPSSPRARVCSGRSPCQRRLPQDRG